MMMGQAIFVLLYWWYWGYSTWTCIFFWPYNAVVSLGSSLSDGLDSLLMRKTCLLGFFLQKWTTLYICYAILFFLYKKNNGKTKFLFTWL